MFDHETPFLSWTKRDVTSVEELFLNTRINNCLKAEGIKTIGQLVALTEAEIMRWPNFGQKSLSEVKEELAHLGLHLGMDRPPNFDLWLVNQENT